MRSDHASSPIPSTLLAEDDPVVEADDGGDHAAVDLSVYQTVRREDVVVADNAPSEKTPQRKTLFRKLICSVRMTVRGKHKMKRSRATSVTFSTMYSIGKFTVVPFVPQFLEIGLS